MIDNCSKIFYYKICQRDSVLVKMMKELELGLTFHTRIGKVLKATIISKALAPLLWRQSMIIAKMECKHSNILMARARLLNFQTFPFATILQTKQQRGQEEHTATILPPIRSPNHQERGGLPRKLLRMPSLPLWKHPASRGLQRLRQLRLFLHPHQSITGNSQEQRKWASQMKGKRALSTN